MRLRIIRSDGWYDVRNGVKHPPGDIIELTDERAVKFIKNQIAVPVPEPPKIETAEAAPPQNAAKRTYKPKPRTQTK